MERKIVKSKYFKYTTISDPIENRKQAIELMGMLKKLDFTKLRRN